MAIEGLLKSQSNEIFLALKEAGWNVSDFEWIRRENPYNALLSPALKHKHSTFYFLFGGQVLGKFTGKFSPSSQVLDEVFATERWSVFVDRFKSWLGYLGREVNAPDLWDELPTESNLIESASDDSDNSQFTKEEKEIIVIGLEEIKQYLLTAHNADAKFLEGQIQYLVESADRLGRKDWKNILISTILSIIIQGGIAGHSAQEIFNFVWTVLSVVLIQKYYLPGL